MAAPAARHPTLFPASLLGEYSEMPGLVREAHDGFMFLLRSFLFLCRC
jgi:hypothetical protein